MLFSQLSHGIGIGLCGSINQGHPIRRGLNCRLHHLGIFSHKDEPPIDRPLDPLHQGFELLGITRVALHGNQIGPQNEAYPFVLQFLKPLQSTIHLIIWHGICHQDGYAGLIYKSLFMTKENGLSSDLQGSVSASDLNGPNGGCRCFG